MIVSVPPLNRHVKPQVRRQRWRKKCRGGSGGSVGAEVAPCTGSPIGAIGARIRICAAAVAGLSDCGSASLFFGSSSPACCPGRSPGPLTSHPRRSPAASSVGRMVWGAKAAWGAGGGASGDRARLPKGSEPCHICGEDSMCEVKVRRPAALATAPGPLPAFLGRWGRSDNATSPLGLLSLSGGALGHCQQQVLRRRPRRRLLELERLVHALPSCASALPMLQLKPCNHEMCLS